MAFLDGGDLVFLRRVDFFYAIFSEILGQGFSGLFILGVIFIAGHLPAFFFFSAQACFFFGCFSLFGEQLITILFRDLVVVWVDFAESQKTVAIAAKVDKCRLQRWFNSGYLGEVDIAFDLLVFGRFEIKFFDPVAFEHRHPSLLVVARVDEHARCHYKISRRGLHSRLSGVAVAHKML